jgi:serine protease Do
VRGWLGVGIQDVTDDLAQSFNMNEPAGALVAEVKKEGPGDKAGIERGDIIVAYNDHPIDASHELPSLVAATPPGKQVELKVLREGKERTVTARVGEMPKEGGETEELEAPESSGEKLGLLVEPVTPEMARSLDIPAGGGVLVKGVKSGSIAEDAGLRPGDVVLEVNRKPVASVADFKRAVTGSKGQKTLLLLVRRGESTLFLALKR